MVESKLREVWDMGSEWNNTSGLAFGYMALDLQRAFCQVSMAENGGMVTNLSGDLYCLHASIPSVNTNTLKFV